ncbi:hypothetical protein FD755_001674, partial [Muntiacus reevesi]
IIVGETAVFCLQLATRDFENQEKTILTGDCCYINPLVRRTVRFLGIYTFGLFATDIFVNAGQVVTGNLAPHFLALCKPNYTALGCQQYTQFISGEEACTGNPDLIMRARKTFPSKEAALSVYAAMYLTDQIPFYPFSLLYNFPVTTLFLLSYYSQHCSSNCPLFLHPDVCVVSWFPPGPTIHQTVFIEHLLIMWLLWYHLTTGATLLLVD